MKANPRFRTDDAVSPVIATILMVAITVVLGATVYLWVSGMGASANAAGPSKSMALTSEGPVSTSGGDFYKSYLLAGASGDGYYRDFRVTLEGETLAPDLGTACAPAAAQSWSVCVGTTPRSADELLTAGDVLQIRTSASPTGAVLRIIDPEGNGILFSVVVQ